MIDTSGLAAAVAGRYSIERELGSGGMAVVYLAKDLKHDRLVALKVLRPEIAAQLGAQRFLREIRLTAQLDHPQILTLIDSGEGGGFLWCVFPYVRGESLRQRLIRDRQLPIDESLQLTRQIAGALDYAHRQGVIHRDIKPENILLFEGQAILADFGVALALSEAGGSRITQTGVSVGTPQYMSPEQATGDSHIDARSDIYSLAAVLYEMLAGQPPHQGMTSQAVIASIITQAPVRLRALRDTVPEPVDEAVSRALAKLPVDRFPSAADFSAALVASRVPVAVERSRRKWLVGVGVVGVALAVLGVAMFSQRDRGSELSRAPVQMTFTGNVTSAAITTDGRRFAFTTRECENTRCKYALTWQDLSGDASLQVPTNLRSMSSVTWSPDGKFLTVEATDSGGRSGISLVNSLTGQTQTLRGRMATFYASSDSLLLTDWDSRSTTIRAMSLASSAYGQDTTINRSLLVPQPSPDGRWIVATEQGVGFYRALMFDRKLRLIDSLPARYYWQVRWHPAGSALVLMAPDSANPNVTRIERQAVDARSGHFVGPSAPLVSGLNAPRDLSVSQDGTLLYVDGPRETVVRALSRTPGQPDVKEIAILTRSTGAAASILAPNGKYLGIMRSAGAARGGLRVVILPVDGGNALWTSQPLTDFGGSDWAPDSRSFLYVDDSSHVVAYDIVAREHRNLGPQAYKGSLVALSATRVVWGDAHNAKTLVLQDFVAKSSIRLLLPDTADLVQGVAHTADDSTLLVAIESRRASDSLIVGLFSIGSGRFVERNRIPGTLIWGMALLDDGSIDLVGLSPPERGRFLWRLPPKGKPIRRSLPYGVAFYDFARDGRSATAQTFEWKQDVWLTRVP